MELLDCLEDNQDENERDLIATALFKIKPTDESIKEKIFVSMFDQTVSDDSPYAAARAARHMIRVVKDADKNGITKQYWAEKALEEFRERAKAENWVDDLINEKVPDMKEFFKDV